MNADDLARRRVIDECPLENCTWAVTGGSADERVAELTGHLSTHPLTDFITEITRLRVELAATTQTLTAAHEEIGKVRDLHSPTGTMYPVCEGDDADGYEVDYPQWPCQTAKIAYSPDEQAEVEQRYADAREKRNAEILKQREAERAARVTVAEADDVLRDIPGLAEAARRQAPIIPKPGLWTP